MIARATLVFSALLFSALLCSGAVCSGSVLAPSPRGPAAGAQTPEVAGEGDAALDKEYELAVEDWRKRLAEAPAEERRALREHPPVVEYWPRFEAAAARGRGRALLWLATHLVEKGAGTREILSESRRLYAELFEKHVSEVWFGAVLDELPGEAHHLEPGKLRAYYLAAIEKNPFPEVRAQAMYQLGKLLYASEDPTERAQGHDWLKKASEIHADTRFGNAALTEISMPVVGELAPDFFGRTIEGRGFRLSDYRGKVVLVDFYGFWCGYCMKAMPHLRELAQQHADEPFAVVGVDANDDAESYARGLVSHGITWTSAYQGPETAISRLYRVNVYPAYFLVDADGTLVQATRSLEELDGPIAELLAKQKAKAPREGEGSSGSPESPGSSSRSSNTPALPTPAGASKPTPGNAADTTALQSTAARAFEPVRTSTLIDELARAAGGGARLASETTEWLGDRELVFSRDLAISAQSARELLEPLLDAFGFVILPEADGGFRIAGPTADALGDVALARAALESGLTTWREHPATYCATLVEANQPRVIEISLGYGLLGAHRPGLCGLKAGVLVWGSGRTVATFATLFGSGTKNGSADLIPAGFAPPEPSADLRLPAEPEARLRQLVAAYGELLDATFVFETPVLEALDRAPIPPHEASIVPREDAARFVESALCAQGFSMMVDRSEAPALLSLHDTRLRLDESHAGRSFLPIFDVVSEGRLEEAERHPALRVGLSLRLEHVDAHKLGLELRGLSFDPAFLSACPIEPDRILVFGRAREVAGMVREIRARDLP